nr:7457_t:CDS:2 [Entrophospora candida]
MVYVDECKKPDSLVVNYKPPEELKQLIDMDLPYNGIGINGLFPIIQDILKYSVNTWHSGFLDKLYAGTNPVGIISEMLMAFLNGNSHVYHDSPVFTLIEYSVSEHLAKLLDMGENSGGITCAGGAFSNQLAMITARNSLYPEFKTKGYFGFNKKLMIFTSNQGHYSIEKTAMTLGLGTESVIKVPCDDQGRMKVYELELLIQQSFARDETPFFVNATTGTTVLGSFDPLREIGKIAKRYNLWFHVDGSWGASLIFSEKYKKLIDGTSLADTLVINPHKMLGIPLQCSFLLAKDKSIFSKNNSLEAKYLFHGNKYDLSDGTVGCGRRPDAVKLFIGWKIFGIKGYGSRIDHAFQMTNYFVALIKKNNSKFKLVLDEPPSLQTCFWYIPNKEILELEKLNHQLYKDKLSKITKEIHKKIYENGKYMIDYAPTILKGVELPFFFRVVVNSPSVCEKDLENLLKEIESIGKDVTMKLFENINESTDRKINDR